MPTKTQLSTRILKRIGVLDPSENPTAQEDTDVQAIMDSIYETEKELGRFEWTLTSIPTRHQEWFIIYVGWFVQPHFGVAASNPVTPDAFLQAQRKLSALSMNVDDDRSNPVVDY